jgi:hypothetical protein
VAIDVSLRTIDGKKKEVLSDPEGRLSAVWPIGDSSFPLLQYVNPYGVTTFGTTQAIQVQKELRVLIDKATDEDQRRLLVRILDFAVQVGQHPHWFLWFSGD